MLVLRHDAIPLAMDSALWKKYNFAKVFEVVDPEHKKPITSNVFWKPKEGTLPLPGMGIDELMKSGVLIGVCNMAITVYSGAVAKMMKMTAEDVKKEWIAGILPGIQTRPFGSAGGESGAGTGMCLLLRRIDVNGASRNRRHPGESG